MDLSSVRHKSQVSSTESGVISAEIGLGSFGQAWFGSPKFRQVPTTFVRLRPCVDISAEFGDFGRLRLSLGCRRSKLNWVDFDHVHLASVWVNSTLTECRGVDLRCAVRWLSTLGFVMGPWVRGLRGMQHLAPSGVESGPRGRIQRPSTRSKSAQMGHICAKMARHWRILACTGPT